MNTFLPLRPENLKIVIIILHFTALNFPAHSLNSSTADIRVCFYYLPYQILLTV